MNHISGRWGQPVEGRKGWPGRVLSSGGLWTDTSSYSPGPAAQGPGLWRGRVGSISLSLSPSQPLSHSTPHLCIGHMGSLGKPCGLHYPPAFLMGFLEPKDGVLTSRARPPQMVQQDGCHPAWPLVDNLCPLPLPTGLTSSLDPLDPKCRLTLVLCRPLSRLCPCCRRAPWGHLSAWPPPASPSCLLNLHHAQARP